MDSIAVAEALATSHRKNKTFKFEIDPNVRKRQTGRILRFFVFLLMMFLLVLVFCSSFQVLINSFVLLLSLIYTETLLLLT